MTNVSTAAERGPATEVARLHMARLKPEHAELFQLLLEDPGIASATLEAFVDHMLEEEGPALQQLAARAKLGVSAALASVSSRAGSTVGDLRRGGFAHHRPTRAGATVGDLRRG